MNHYFLVMLKFLVSEKGCEGALQVLLIRVDEKLLDERLHHSRYASVQNGPSVLNPEIVMI